MNKYIAMLKDKARGSLNDTLLNQHVSHLKRMNQEGKLFICGPFKDNDGAIQILLANTKEEAEKLIQQDPFIVNKYYKQYSIYELLEANEDNNYLTEDTQTVLNKTKR